MSVADIPRPFKFNAVNQMFSYPSINFEEKKQPRPPPNLNFPKMSENHWFELYNVSNLLLANVSKCNVQVLVKNIVLNEQDIHPHGLLHQVKAETRPASKNLKSNPIESNNFLQTSFSSSNKMLTTMSNQSKNLGLNKKQKAHQSKSSKQFAQNELLFSFRKIQQQKKAKKKKFLDSIQAKLSIIQQQAKQLESYNLQEGINLQQIENIKKQIDQSLTSNAFHGRLNKKIHASLQDQQEDQDNQLQRQFKSINQNMGPAQINHVLENHFSQNQKLLDQIIQIKSQSKQKTSLNKTAFEQSHNAKKNTLNSFNKTVVNQRKNSLAKTRLEIPKKIMSATAEFPPKYKKN